MLVLHAGLIDRTFYVWGESPPRSHRSGRPARTRSKQGRIARLPYDAGAELVAAVVPPVDGSGRASKPPIRTLIAWLPTAKGSPRASTPLIAETDPAAGEPAIAPWRLTACELTAAQALEFLCACVDRETLVPGVVIGPDVRVLTHAMRFAGALVARQQFLPSVDDTDGSYTARWEPSLAGNDAERLRALAAAAPHACLALSRTAERPPAIEPVGILRAFIGTMVDHLVRSNGSPAVDRAAFRPASRRRSFSSVHDAWVSALQSPDPEIAGEEAALAALAEQVRAWQRPVVVAHEAPVRLCFRLEEPPAADLELLEDDASLIAAAEASAGAEWRVRYLVQARDDPSLLAPLADVWAGNPRTLRLFTRAGRDPREYVLHALGRAAALDARIGATSNGRAPGEHTLDAEGAYQFLTEKAWALEQSGFGVILPAWWMGRGPRAGLTSRARITSPRTSSGGGLSLDALVVVDWQVALGDRMLSLRDLQALAALKVPLVRTRGQWMHVDREQLQRAIDLLERRRTAVTAREAIRLALGGAASADAPPVDDVAAVGWIGDLLARLRDRTAFEELPPPESFIGTLRPYQRRGYSWLAFLRHWGLGACLADDMGLGKTVQTLAFLRRERNMGSPGPTLLICPTSVVSNWQKEAARFTPDLPVLVHHGISRVRGEAFAKEVEHHALVISSYALLHRDLEILAGIPWRGVVLDEAQNIKNPETRQARAARSLQAEYRITLTGTPVENTVGDLWSIMEFLNPGLLGTRAQFQRRFFMPIQMNRDPAAAERLKRLTGPFILRRVKTDRTIIADLPLRMDMKVFCTLTREQASLYAAVVQETERALATAEGIGRKGLVLATLSKLKQVCNHPVQFLRDGSALAGRSGKLARLTEMLEEVRSTGERALVFTQFAEMGSILQTHLQETFGREVLFLHGGVARGARERMVERFQSGGAGPFVFVLSLKAGGTGLNLTAANHVFLFDRWWNPAVEAQAADRAFRIGQRRRVQVHRFLCAGTLEERIDEMIERKQQLAAGLVGTGEAWLTELSTGELRTLFALRPEALGD
jgi:SNF2 family DNA or RNA helicase